MQARVGQRQLPGSPQIVCRCTTAFLAQSQARAPRHDTASRRLIRRKADELAQEVISQSSLRPHQQVTAPTRRIVGKWRYRRTSLAEHFDVSGFCEPLGSGSRTVLMPRRIVVGFILVGEEWLALHSKPDREPSKLPSL